jgi:hypothetical protein
MPTKRYVVMLTSIKTTATKAYTSMAYRAMTFNFIVNHRITHRKSLGKYEMLSALEGWWAVIRLVLAHEHDLELPEQLALEYLATLSVLARWISEAELDEADDTAVSS